MAKKCSKIVVDFVCTSLRLRKRVTRFRFEADTKWRRNSALCMYARNAAHRKRRARNASFRLRKLNRSRYGMSERRISSGQQRRRGVRVADGSGMRYFVVVDDVSFCG
ncbi:unnamed protein product [Toxocara canis]|uniref:50S ribosomal protein L18 n=1 Tax=Toxocara canis TaxID=6265 RepID=A0A183U4L0_TOXCA|nr:unnamed protein product [Toxocara canis]